MAIISFSIVLIVGFWRHGFHFFSLFIPHGTPMVLLPLIFLIELLSFMVRPFSLALRLFVAMIAGHILVEVFGSFVVSGLNAGGAMGPAISLLSLRLHRRRQRARAAGLRDPGLCVRAADLALHQRRGQSSLDRFNRFTKELIMDFASAKVIGAGLAAIGVGAAAIGVGNVFGSFLESAIRNPAAADGQQGRLFIGFAAAELLGLIAFAVAMIILYVALSGIGDGRSGTVRHRGRSNASAQSARRRRSTRSSSGCCWCSA